MATYQTLRLRGSTATSAMRPLENVPEMFLSSRALKVSAVMREALCWASVRPSESRAAELAMKRIRFMGSKRPSIFNLGVPEGAEVTYGMQISRRGWVAGAGALLAGCAARRVAVGPPAGGARLARVRVAQDRVIRTIAGLRPFRPSGFVVRGRKDGREDW